MRTELRNTTLEGRTVSEFLLRIQAILDSLASVGDPVSVREHLDVILQGLPRDYESVVTLVSSKLVPLNVAEIEALLLSHEARLKFYNKHALSEAAAAFVNLTQSTPSAPHQVQKVEENTPPQVQLNHASATDSTSQDPEKYRNDRGRGNKNGRGQGRGKSNVQCQLCDKFGHTSTVCW